MSLVNRKMHIKITMRHHCTPVTVLKMKKKHQILMSYAATQTFILGCTSVKWCNHFEKWAVPYKVQLIAHEFHS